MVERLEDRSLLSTFVDVSSSALPGVEGLQDSSAAWADYNGDGRLDLLITDARFAQTVTQLWQQNSNGTFTDVTSKAFPTGIPAVGSSSVAWADYNNDGRPDLLITGGDNSGQRVTEL